MVTDPALIPYIEARVVIHIHEGGIPTDRAMDLAMQAQGFRSQTRYWAWLRVYMEKKTPLVGTSLWSAQRTTTNNTNSQYSFPSYNRSGHTNGHSANAALKQVAQELRA